MRRLVYAAILVFVLACAIPCRAELNDKDLKAAGQMAKGKLYLRIDLPCHYFSPGVSFWNSSAISLGRSMATWVEPMVEITPSEVRAHSAMPDHLAGDVVWRFRPNDAVAFSKVYNNGDLVDVDLEGLPPNVHEVIARFVGVKTLADFKAAFDRTFSRVPLQDEHPEWPEAIRKAIAERRVIPGMTAEQAFCVLGQVVNKEKSREAGSEVETWYPRLTAFHSVEAKALVPTDFPKSVKFVNGSLSEVGEKGKPEPLSKFSDDFLQQAKKMVLGKKYLRIDMPYRYHPQMDAMVEVSPEGFQLPGTTVTDTDNMYWGLRPNAGVNPDKVTQSGGAVEVRKGGRSGFAVLFVGIKTIDDFKAAFARTFSPVPLQDEHTDWPAAVRKAIADRAVIKGMTPEQTYCVTGTPISLEKREENGAKVEVWSLREEVKVGDRSSRPLKSLTFIGGELVTTPPPSGKGRG